MPAKKNVPRITSRLPIDKAIGFNPSSDKPFYARCPIVAELGDEKASIRAYYQSNGADTPRAFWSLWGIAPTDPRVTVGAMFHDEGCENPDCPQIIADALFVSLLGPIYWNGVLLPGINRFQQFVFYCGVRMESLFFRPTTRMFFRKES